MFKPTKIIIFSMLVLLASVAYFGSSRVVRADGLSPDQVQRFVAFLRSFEVPEATVQQVCNILAGQNAVSICSTTSTFSGVPPALRSPADGTTGVSTTPTIAWSTVPGARGYGFQIATDSNFNTVIVGTQPMSNYSVQYYTPYLSPGKVYWWHANANDGTTESPWSSAWSFMTGS